MEEEASLKAVLEMSKKEAVEGAVQETPPTNNGSGGDLLGLNFGTSSGIDGLDGGWGGVQGVWSTCTKPWQDQLPWCNTVCMYVRTYVRPYALLSDTAL